VKGESNSISNQKRMIEEYMKKNGFHNPILFTDDGISGTRFDHPGFLVMMKEVEVENVDTIILKDSSRIG